MGYSHNELKTIKGIKINIKLMKKIKKNIKIVKFNISPIKEISVPQRGIILKDYSKKKKI